MQKKEKNKKKKVINNLTLLMLAQKQDCEAFHKEDFEIKKDFKSEYADFYNDVKQKNKFVKEDW